jgi:tetratricopeptide (TPR) repeat protein
MSGAVFLSYASQDAEAARRICESLRTAGVEVWFDQSELRGGDAWDAKIRRQIKECALFVPVISANTQAREEGYFRLEWLLAVERARLRADDAHFLLPIAIDGTPEATARVPDRFREVQWTRLNVQETPPLFAERVAKLLSKKSDKSVAAAESGERAERAAHSPKPAKRSTELTWLTAIVGIGFGLVLAWRFWPHRPAGPVATGAGTAPLTAQAGSTLPAAPNQDWPHDLELKKAMQMIDALNATAEDFEFAEEIAQRAVDKSPADAEAVTVLARVESQFLLRNFDSRAERFSLAKRYAERAVQLAPDDPEALYAQAVAVGFRAGKDPAQAETLLRRACELDPGKPYYWRELAANIARERPTEGLVLAEQDAVRFPNDALTHYDLSILYRDADRMRDFDRELDATVRLGPVANAFDWKARVAFVRGDMGAMKTWIDRVPAKNRSEERTTFTRFVYAATSGHFDEGLVALQGFSEPWFLDASNYAGPTALLTAELLSLEGKPELAHLEYEAALAEVQRHTAANPADVDASITDVYILRGLGRVDEARARNRLYLETLRRPFRAFPLSLWWLTAIPANLLLGEHDTAMQLMRETTTTAEGRNWLRACLRLDPRMAPWRDEPGIKALLAEPPADVPRSVNPGLPPA